MIPFILFYNKKYKLININIFFINIKNSQKKKKNYQIKLLKY